MNRQFIQAVSIHWDEISEHSHLKQIPALHSIEELTFENPITFFAGENGSGKSTLLEAIAVAYGFNAEGGTRNYRFSTYDDVSELSREKKKKKGFRRPHSGYFFRAESFFNVATKAEEYRDGDDKSAYYSRFGGKSLHEQSHGESFLSYFQSFDQEGLFLMDEPEAALSPQRQLTLFIQMAKMAERGSQFIVATHSPILLGIPDAQILTFDDGAVRPCRYEDTESYQITELFINNREILVQRLLEEDNE